MRTTWRSLACGFACLLLMAGVGCSGGTDSPTPTVTSDRDATTATGRILSSTPQLGATTLPPGAQHTVAISAGHGGPPNVRAGHKDAQGNTQLVHKVLTNYAAPQITPRLLQPG